MKLVFIVDYFTGQSNTSCFDSIEKIYDDLSLFYEGHDKNCACHIVGHWSGMPQTGMLSNCTCGLIDNETFQGFVKPMMIDDNAKGVWYNYETDKFTREKPEQSKSCEFLILDQSCYQSPANQ